MQANESAQAAVELFDVLVDSASPETLLAVLVEGFRLRPERASFASRLAALVRRSGMGPQLAAIDAGVRADLEELADRSEPDPWYLHTAALFCLHDPKSRDLNRAAGLVRRALDLAKRDDPDFLATLAEIETARGNRASAILALETAWSQPDVSRDIGSLLDAARRDALPVAPSFESIDAWIADLAADGTGDADALAAYRSHAETPVEGSVLGYFEACVLLRREHGGGRDPGLGPRPLRGRRVPDGSPGQASSRGARRGSRCRVPGADRRGCGRGDRSPPDWRVIRDSA